MSVDGLRGWGIIICVLLAIGAFVGTVLLITHPEFSPLGWIGVVIDSALLIFMWESVKKIGAK